MDQIKSDIFTSLVMKVEHDDDSHVVNSAVDQVEIKEEHVEGELICKFEAEESGIQSYIKAEVQDTLEIKDENIEGPFTSMLEIDTYNINQVGKNSCNTFECKNVNNFQSNLKSSVNNILSIRPKKAQTKNGYTCAKTKVPTRKMSKFSLRAAPYKVPASAASHPALAQYTTEGVVQYLRRLYKDQEDMDEQLNAALARSRALVEEIGTIDIEIAHLTEERAKLQCAVEDYKSIKDFLNDEY